MKALIIDSLNLLKHWISFMNRIVLTNIRGADKSRSFKSPKPHFIQSYSYRGGLKN